MRISLITASAQRYPGADLHRDIYMTHEKLSLLCVQYEDMLVGIQLRAEATQPSSLVITSWAEIDTDMYFRTSLVLKYWRCHDYCQVTEPLQI